MNKKCIRVGSVMSRVSRLCAGVALALLVGGGVTGSEAQCARCATGTLPLPRTPANGSTNFMSAHVNRDLRAGSGNCFYANGSGRTRKLVSGRPLRFVVSFIPVLDMTTVTRTGGGSLTLSANMASSGPSGGLEGGATYSVATTRGGFITLNTSTFTAVTDGSTRMATVSSRFCPMIPTARVWMQGIASFANFGADNVTAMTQAI